MVPIRFIAKSFGLQVQWEDRYNAVVIGTQPAMPVLAPWGDPDIEMPCQIRVAMRKMGSNEPNPNGAIYEVKTIRVADYVADVLAHEFGDFTEDRVPHRFTDEALKAGAVCMVLCLAPQNHELRLG